MRVMADEDRIEELVHQVKPAFKEHYVKLLGSVEAYERFIRAALRWPRKSIRVNTLKISVQTLRERLEAKGWRLEPVPWCPEGFFIQHPTGRRDIGNLEEHALGYVYVQEASSMAPPVVLNPQPGELVWDATAAPGSKTTQMAAMMRNEGVILANELDASRIASLKANLERMGVWNVIITQSDARRFTLEGFDAILLDAPCSGTGTLSKSLKPLEWWSERGLLRLSRIQYSLLTHAYSLLKPGGRLVYSTCSLEPLENEAVLTDFFARHPEAETLPISLPGGSPAFTVLEGSVFDERVRHAVRFWPHETGTDGFFIILIRKPA